MACHEELGFGGWKKGNTADEIWKGSQLRGCKFVSVAVELGRKRKVRVGSFVVLVAFDVESNGNQCPVMHRKMWISTSKNSSS